MIVSPPDRMNYFKGVLLLYQKKIDDRDPLEEYIKKFVNILRFDSEFCEFTMRDIMRNLPVIDEPPHFSAREMAKIFIKEKFNPFDLIFSFTDAFVGILELMAEFARIISFTFRLFGNIMGGSIIILVVSYLTYSVILPPFLNAFIGLFVGTIQAFVFTMLTVVYISVQVK